MTPNPLRSRAAALILGGLLLLAVAPHGLAADTTTTTTNATPVMEEIHFYGSDPSAGSGATCASAGRTGTFDPTAGSVTTIHVCVQVADDNGYNDVCDSGAASAQDVRRFSVTDAAGASISDASHVKTDVTLTCATGDGVRVALLGSFQMEYWRAPGSSAASSAYVVTPQAIDMLGASAAAATRSFNYTALTSLDASSVGTLGLGGALAPGATGSDVTATLYNKGNVDFTLHVSGTNLTGSSRGQTIDVSNLKWSTSSGAVYATKTAMGHASASTSLSAPAETADGTTGRALYLQLGVPSGAAQWMPADTYAGTVTFATG